MSEGGIRPVVMPKWGLSMSQGTITEWLVAEGQAVEPGMALVEVETDKIAGTLESSEHGVLRGVVAETGANVPVGATIAILAPPEVADDRVSAAVAEAHEQLASGAVADQAGPRVDAVEVDGRRLSYAELGESQDTVVLVHGYGGDKNSWLFVQESLSTSATVDALDLPGHGESTKDVGDGTVQTLAAATLGYLEARNIPHAHLVGHSLGGAVAAAVAAQAEDRVDSLTLVAPAGFSERANGDFLRGFAAASSRRELKPQLEKLFADPAQVTRRLVDDVLKYKRLDGVRDVLETLQDTLLDGDRQVIDCPGYLARTSVPVAVVWGAADAVLPLPDHAQSRSGWRVVDGAGHMVHLERPNAVRDAVLAHLRGP